jgi:hypothetical protein
MISEAQSAAYDAMREVAGRADLKRASELTKDSYQKFWVIDPWMNIACRAGHYKERVESKLEEWRSQGKVIQGRPILKQDPSGNPLPDPGFTKPYAVVADALFTAYLMPNAISLERAHSGEPRSRSPSFVEQQSRSFAPASGVAGPSHQASPQKRDRSGSAESGASAPQTRSPGSAGPPPRKITRRP